MLTQQQTSPLNLCRGIFLTIGLHEELDVIKHKHLEQINFNFFATLMT